ncbi:hypothetical protein PIB30_050183 [Stylosanthes scabra]|uniref:Protein FAR1-RELATED SEQUENCE n=1 Tax=Stylosanthes scabra TaxID=79078 RepID=A0ABU6SHH3_9FABA|nr:hypothetical protein [Stylosanthes scabra]
MHAFFNKFITRKSSLVQLVKQYDNCLHSKEQKEREANAADAHSVIPYATNSSIEAQFQHVYTQAKFKEVQAQFREKVNCTATEMHRVFGIVCYEISEQISRAFRIESKGMAAILHRAYDKAYVEMQEFKAKEKEVKTIITHEDGSLNEMNELQSHNTCSIKRTSEEKVGFKFGKTNCKCFNKKKRKALFEINAADENSRLVQSQNFPFH